MFSFAPGDTTSSDNGGTIIVTFSGEGYYRLYNDLPINICWFGAYLNSSNDSAPALNGALNLISNNGGAIYFPPGTFNFNSTISFSTPNVENSYSVLFFGNGPDVTVLNWPSNNAFNINVSFRSHSLHVRDLTISTSSAGTYTAVTISLLNYDGDFGQNDFTRISFRGQVVRDEFWSTAVEITGLSNVLYDTILVYGGSGGGSGISIKGGENLTTSTSIVHNFIGCGFYGGSMGIIYGNNTQGISVSQCNFTGGQTGLIQPSGPGGFQLSVSSSQFNVTRNGIDIQTSNSGVSIIGNLFFVPYSSSYAGIKFESDYIQQVSIVGNSFEGAGDDPYQGNGIVSGPNANSGVVSGNSFINLNIGVDLTGASGWNVLGNVYSGTVNTQVIPGTGNSVGVATN